MFKIIQIKKQHTTDMAVSSGSRNGLAKQIMKHAPVRQVCQAVVCSLILDKISSLLLICYISAYQGITGHSIPCIIN